MSIPIAEQVWLITGCSTGFGHEMARQLLERGARVVATARDPASLAGLRDAAGPDPHRRLLTARLDVTSAADIAAVMSEANGAFGRIDVLINNAGYGYLTSAEEGEDAEIRAMFEANVFGLFAVTRAVLPTMRGQRSGTIVNVSSIAGLVARAASAYYGATKYAVEAFTSALRAEVETLGIVVMAVEPGPFRTDWAGRSLRITDVGIEDYREIVGGRLSGTTDLSGRQQGDPERACAAIIDAVLGTNPPLHLVLGAYAIDLVRQRWQESLDELARWDGIGRATDFPEAAP